MGKGDKKKQQKKEESSEEEVESESESEEVCAPASRLFRGALVLPAASGGQHLGAVGPKLGTGVQPSRPRGCTVAVLPPLVLVPPTVGHGPAQV